MPSFKNQNLQGRSFRHQILMGADFSGADIRGCTFDHAQLSEANFERAKAGLSPRKFAWLSGGSMAIALFVGDALSRLIFSALGQIPVGAAWSFVLVLYGVLSLVSASAGVSLLINIPLKISRLAGTVSAVMSGTLLGFFMPEVRRGIIQRSRSQERSPQVQSPYWLASGVTLPGLKSRSSPSQLSPATEPLSCSVQPLASVSAPTRASDLFGRSLH